MKHVFESNEVAHKWASQSQDNGRNAQGNFYFEGKSIFSYGGHFEIARFVKPDVTLHTSRGYSVTTAKHKSNVWQAVSHTRRFIVPYLTIEYQLNHDENIKWMEKEIIDSIDTLKKSRSRINYRKMEVTGNIGRLYLYAKEFKTGRDIAGKWYRKRNSFISKTEIAKLNAAAEKVEARNKQRQETIRAKNQARGARYDMERKAEEIWGDEILALNVEAWKKGTFNNLVGLGYNVPYALRLEGNEIVTTHGARVPVRDASGKDAVNLWRLIQEGKPIHGVIVGSYEVSGIRDGFLVVGCHRIPVKELARMAIQLNLGA